MQNGNEPLRRIVDAMGPAIIATDLGGRVTTWNRAAEGLYGWRADEALGRSIVELTPSRASEAQAREIMEQLRAGRAWAGDFEVQRRDGSVFLARVIDTPILDEEASSAASWASPST